MTEQPAVERHWKVRGLAAALFGGAAILFGSLLALVDHRDALDLSAYSVVAAAIVGFVAGPKLQRRAREQGAPAKGALDGVIVTVVAYVVGGLAMTVRASDGFLDYAGVVGVVLAIGLIVLLPAMIFGGIAGWVFRRSVLRWGL